MYYLKSKSKIIIPNIQPNTPITAEHNQMNNDANATSINKRINVSII